MKRLMKQIEEIFKNYKNAVKLKDMGATTTPPEMLWDMAITELHDFITQQKEVEYNRGYLEGLKEAVNKLEESLG